MCKYYCNGNVLFLILIAVALFAALSYAVTNSGRSGGDTSKEQQKLNQAEIDNYTANINLAVQRLSMTGCGDNLDWTPPASQTSGGDKSCHIFHPDGGGAYWKDIGFGCADEILGMLDIGESCGVIVYAGEFSGSRLYTTAGDQGVYTWNNGSSNWGSIGANSHNDGMFNTNKMLSATDLGAPYPAAESCRSLGEEWYWPSRLEMGVVFANRNVGVFAGTFSTKYWVSTEYDDDGAYPGSCGGGLKSASCPVRCIRQ